MDAALSVFVLLLLFLLEPASSSPLSTSGFLAGCACVEECVTEESAKPYCFVEDGKCPDQIASGFRWTSEEACRGNTPTNCRGVSGSRCIFPFTFAGETFHQCTIHESVNGAAWCPTRLRSPDRVPVRGFLEDCIAPCNNGSIPAANPSCPRNPVEEKSAGCCTADDPCQQGEGSCEGDEECRSGLKCGDRNCGHFRWENYAKHNCCYDPFRQGNLAVPSGELKMFKLNEAGHIECTKNLDCPAAVTDKEKWVFITYRCAPQKEENFSICEETEQDYCESPSRAANERKCREYDVKVAQCEEDKKCNGKEVFAGQRVRLTGGLGGIGTIRSETLTIALTSSFDCSIPRRGVRGSCPANKPCRDRTRRKPSRCCRVYAVGYRGRLVMCPWGC